MDAAVAGSDQSERSNKRARAENLVDCAVPADLTLLCDNGTIKVHSQLLAVASPVLDEAILLVEDSHGLCLEGGACAGLESVARGQGGGASHHNCQRKTSTDRPASRCFGGCDEGSPDEWRVPTLCWDSPGQGRHHFRGDSRVWVAGPRGTRSRTPPSRHPLCSTKKQGRISHHATCPTRLAPHAEAGNGLPAGGRQIRHRWTGGGGQTDPDRCGGGGQGA